MAEGEFIRPGHLTPAATRATTGVAGESPGKTGKITKIHPNSSEEIQDPSNGRNPEASN